MPVSGTLLQERYLVAQQISTGGMGAVYLAHDRRLGHLPVVVKENLAGDPEQFQTEATLLATIQHPNLPRVTDYFVEPSGAEFLVMDYIQGRDLEASVLQQGPLDESAVLGWMRQVFAAVRYLHEQRVIHRDIKPTNIIITPQGRAVLVDLGIAKVLASGTRTIAGARAGSPGFAPPEQYAGGTSERSDIYALGATLYFVLTGQVPLDAPHRAAGELLVPAQQLAPQLRPQTLAVISTAMQLDIRLRYGSVEEMEQALYSQQPVPAFADLPPALQPLPASTLQPVPPPPAGSWSSVEISFTHNLHTLLQQQQQRPALRVRISNEWVRQLAWSPDGQLIAAAALLGVYLYDAATQTRLRLLEHTDWAWAVAFMPGGKALASGGADGLVRLWRVSDGSLRHTIQGHTRRVTSLAFSPDGQLLASGGEDWTVRLWHTRDGGSRQLLTGHTDEVTCVAFSPDSGLVASGSEDASLRVWQAADGRLLHELTDHRDWIWSVAFSPDGLLLASSSKDGSVRLYRPRDGSLVRTLDARSGGVLSVAFNANGTLLATGDQSGYVRIWRVADGQQLRVLGRQRGGWLSGLFASSGEGHSGEVTSVAFSPDDSMLASAGQDGLRVWRLDE